VGKKLYELQILGKHKRWNFAVYVDPQYVKEWTADGLVIEEVCNVIPEWVADMRLTRAWCFLQDAFNFTNPFKGYGGRDDG
jgi:hypothetical protein